MQSFSPARLHFEKLCEQLTQQLLVLQSNPASQLEKDLVKATLRELYQVLDELGPETARVVPVQPATVRPEPVNREILKEMPSDPEPAPVAEIETGEPLLATSVGEATPDPEPESELPPAEIAPLISPEIQKDLHEARKSVFAETIARAAEHTDTVTIGSRYSAGESLSDRIAQAGQPTRLSDQLQHKPVEDLRVSIGLNERFAFINGLFAGNQQAFYTAIDTLNSAKGFQDAQSELDNLRATYGWQSLDKQVIEFTELVKRRFGI